MWRVKLALEWGGMSEWFDVRVGLRQGCVMSPWLFNLLFDGVVRRVRGKLAEWGAVLKGANGEVFGVNQLLFADDAALVAESESGLKELVKVFGEACGEVGLCVNVDKSKVMSCSRRGDESELNVCLDGVQLREVESFVYLGARVDARGGIEGEVSERVKKAYGVWGALGRVMKNRVMGLEVKRRLYESVVLPTVLYGAETWGLRGSERRMLNVFEMRCLRGMCGVSRMERVRNEFIRERVGVNGSLDRKVDERVLRWFGHVGRMDEECLVRRVGDATVEGARGRGRPRFRWMDGVRGALSERGLSVLDARELVLDRVEWRRVVRGGVR